MSLIAIGGCSIVDDTARQTQPWEGLRSLLLVARALTVLSLLALGTPLSGICRGADVDHRIQQLSPRHLPNWDNLEGPPLWLRGPAPFFSLRDDMHVCHLEPGSGVQFLVPPRSMIRLVPAQQSSTLDHLEVWLSNGSGLYQRLTPIVDQDGQSWIMAPDCDDTTIAHVLCPSIRSVPARGSCKSCSAATICASCKDNIGHPCKPTTLGIFLSRYDPLLFPDGKFSELMPCVRKARISSDPLGGGELHQYLRGCEASHVDVVGPCRIRLVSRLVYHPHDTQSKQEYNIQVQLGGSPFETLECLTDLSLQRPTYVAGKSVLLGIPQDSHLTIPTGCHRVTIIPSNDLYVRFETLEGEMYKHPQLQARLLGSHSLTSGRWSSIWELTDSDLFDQFRNRTGPLEFQELAAHRIARDTRYRRGGVDAAIWLRGLSAYYADATELRHLANQFEQHHTYYTELVPTAGPSELTPRSAWFTPRALASIGEKPFEQVVPAQFVTDYVGQLARGTFVECSRSCAEPLQYALPLDHGATWLRLAVDPGPSTQGALVYVQFDDELPIELRLASEPLGPQAYKASKAELGLSAMDYLHRTTTAGTYGGPFGLRRIPGDRVSVSTVELPVAARVSSVRVWTSCPDTHYVALHYRRSRQYQLSETVLINELRCRPITDLTFLLSLLHPDSTNQSDRSSAELRNHYEPLMRRIRAHHSSFSAHIRPREQHAGEGEAEPPRIDATQQLQDAAILAKRGNWIGALENWSQALPVLQGAERLNVLAARVESLLRSDEAWLAEIELRGLMLYDPDPLVREKAFAIYLEEKRKFDDWRSIEQAASAYLFAHPQEATAVVLVGALTENGNFNDALHLGLALPTHARPWELLVRSAYQVRCWHVFDEARREIPSPEERNYWLGLRQLQCGAYDQALRCFNAAGPDGEAVAERWSHGVSILKQLRLSTDLERWEAIFAWEQWMAQAPGPYMWQEQDHVVTQCEGFETVRSVESDVVSTWYRATPAIPLQIDLLGPVRVRVEGRTLIPEGASNSTDDWLHIHGDGKHFLMPVADSTAAEGSELVRHPLVSVGRHFHDEIQLGPGRHRFRIWCDRNEAIFRFQLRVPETPLPVLPMLNASTLRKVVAGPLDKRSPSPVAGDTSTCAPAVVAVRDAGQPGNEHQMDSSWTTVTSDTTSAMQPLDDNSVTQARINQRLGSITANCDNILLAWSANDNTSSDASEKIDTQLRLAGEFPGKLLLNANTMLLPRHQQAVWHHWQMFDREQLLANQSHDKDDQRLAMIVHKLEQSDPKQRLLIATGLLSLQTRTELPPTDRLLKTRLMQSTEWTLFEQYQSSAGIQRKRQMDWVPESPVMRTRKALMDSSTADYSIQGRERFTLTLDQPAPTTVVIRFHQPLVSYWNLPLATIQWQFNDGPVAEAPLNNETRANEITIPVTAGLTRITAWIREPLLGQIVLVNLASQTSSTSGTLPAPATSRRFDEREREYQVMTIEEPVKFAVVGPAVLRVDMIDSHGTSSRVIPVLKDRHEFVLTPSSDQSTAYVRVYELQTTADTPPLSPHLLPDQSIPLPQPWIDHSTEQFSPGAIALANATTELQHPNTLWPELGNPWILHSAVWDDTHRLGHQEDGTWSLGTSWFQRRALEEALDDTSDPDTFWQVDVSHLMRTAGTDRYTEGMVLTRFRDEGGPTFGFQIDRRNPLPLELLLAPFPSLQNCAWLTDWSYHGTLYGYLQDPGRAIGQFSGGMEATSGFTANASRNWQMTDHLRLRPSMTLFGRLMSMDQPIYPGGNVDQDIFTDYKNDHRVGWQIAPMVVVQPAPDLRWWAQSTISTNEDFNPIRPDFWALRSGNSHLLGPVQLEYSYRFARYFQDDDRADAVNRHQLDLHAMVEHWHSTGFRSELALGIRHEVTTDGTSAQIQWRAFRSHGRGYSDISPNDSSFLELRKIREVWNRGRLIDQGL